METTVRQLWNIDPAVFDFLPTELLEIVRDQKAGLRERLRAIEIVTKMHGQNQADTPQVDLQQKQCEDRIRAINEAPARLKEILDRLAP